MEGAGQAVHAVDIDSIVVVVIVVAAVVVVVVVVVKPLV